MSAPAANSLTDPLPWTDAAAVALPARPAALWSWLVDEGSLTQRLRARVGAGFALQVLTEMREPLRRADALRMGVAPAQSALIREVRLDADGRCAIHAVTVIPSSTLAAHPRLAALGTRPLGEAIFDAAFMGIVAQREPFEVACLAPDHALAARARVALDRSATNAAQGIWARRSVVRLGAEPLLIHECFVADWGW